MMTTLKEVFTNIYTSNKWGSAESFSGPGSELRQTVSLREFLPQLIQQLSITSMLDAPCGDFNWMQHVVRHSSLHRYLGVDIVSELIEVNQKEFVDPRIAFACKDLTKDLLPKVDLIFSRDCMVHLSNEDVISALQRMKESESTYLLATTYRAEDSNRDTSLGKWRPINLEKAPFNLPPALKYFDTDFQDNGKNHPGNGMALWRLAEIELP